MFKFSGWRLNRIININLVLQAKTAGFKIKFRILFLLLYDNITFTFPYGAYAKLSLATSRYQKQVKIAMKEIVINQRILINQKGQVALFCRNKGILSIQEKEL